MQHGHAQDGGVLQRPHHFNLDQMQQAVNMDLLPQEADGPAPVRP